MYDRYWKNIYIYVKHVCIGEVEQGRYRCMIGTGRIYIYGSRV